MQVLTVAASDRSNKTSKAQRSEPDGTKVMKNNQIGTIASWGPTFRFAVDIIVHSEVGSSGWGSILRFTSTSQDWRHMGDRIPAIWYRSNGSLQIASAVGRNTNYAVYYNIDLKKWYHIEIAQTWKMDGKVSEINNFLS